MSQCLLAQINPILPKDSEEARALQLHHAHQVCAIVTHTDDRGVASVSIRSLAIVAEVLTDRAEQNEVITTLEKIDRETGWKLGAVVKNLKRVWGWGEKAGGMGLAAHFLSGPGPQATTTAMTTTMQQRHKEQSHKHHPQTSTPPGPPAQLMPGLAAAQTHGPAPAQGPKSPVAAPRPIRVSGNPLNCADFSLPNHPYQNWYEPPSRSNIYNSSETFP